MVDLVGFVSFTEAHGDSAAHHAARHLHDVGDIELRRVGGTIVKPLGDGFMGTATRSDAAIDAVRQVAHRCRRPDGERWPLRASVHRGRPIAFRGDLSALRGAPSSLLGAPSSLRSPPSSLRDVDAP